jgi:hypothetical protein
MAGQPGAAVTHDITGTNPVTIHAGLAPVRNLRAQSVPAGARTDRGGAHSQGDRRRALLCLTRLERKPIEASGTVALCPPDQRGTPPGMMAVSVAEHTRSNTRGTVGGTSKNVMAAFDKVQDRDGSENEPAHAGERYAQEGALGEGGAPAEMRRGGPRGGRRMRVSSRATKTLEMLTRPTRAHVKAITPTVVQAARDSRLCCARTRKGLPCVRRVVPGRNRCPSHGGLSTGPTTEAGKTRIAAAQRARWQRWRQERLP